MKARTRCWTKRSSRSLTKQLQRVGYKKVKVTLVENRIKASFDMVYPNDRRRAEGIGERMGLTATGGGTDFGDQRSDVTWQIRWRKLGRRR